MILQRLKNVPTSQIVALWNDELGTDFPMTPELWTQNVWQDACTDEDASLGVMEDTKLVAFVVVKKIQQTSAANMDSTIGWINSLLVKSANRGQGIGSTLLELAERALSNKEEIRLGRDPWHFFPGIPAEDPQAQSWFQKRGYEAQSTETDLLKTHANNKLEKLPDDNSLVTFRLLKPQELPQLDMFLASEFPGRWHYELLEYLRYEGTGREFLGLFIDEQLKGFCRINDRKSPIIAQNTYWSGLFSSSLGGIGPLGIARDIRKQGLGLELVQSAVTELEARGIHTMVIDWTQLVAFYEKLGFTPWKHYVTYSKNRKVGSG